MNEIIKIPKQYSDLIDQIFEIERKLERIDESNSIHRNINKMKDVFEHIGDTASENNIGFTYHNPIGEDYNETRIDLEASIAGDSTKELVIIEVIKPIIRYKKGNSSVIARKGVVIVESKNKK